MSVRNSQRAELAEFLRSRRNRISPESVGLPAGSRRRTPGLRREEVAQLAGVGVTWYTWLEQGRPIKASNQVLQSIARVLRFDRDECDHLLLLGGGDTGGKIVAEPLSPAIAEVLDGLDPYPARIVNERWDVLAYNRSWTALMGEFSDLPPAARNVLYLLFTEPRWRAMLLDWADDSARVVAQFRSSMARHLTEPTWTELAEELRRRSADFSRLWARHDVAGSAPRVKRYQHPTVGPLNLVSSSFDVASRPDTRMTVYTPCDEPTRESLERLAIQPVYRPWAPQD